MKNYKIPNHILALAVIIVLFSTFYFMGGFEIIQNTQGAQEKCEPNLSASGSGSVTWTCDEGKCENRKSFTNSGSMSNDSNLSQKQLACDLYAKIFSGSKPYSKNQNPSWNEKKSIWKYLSANCVEEEEQGDAQNCFIYTKVVSENNEWRLIVNMILDSTLVHQDKINGSWQVGTAPLPPPPSELDVDILLNNKLNGKGGSTILEKGEKANLTWTSTGVSSCEAIEPATGDYTGGTWKGDVELNNSDQNKYSYAMDSTARFRIKCCNDSDECVNDEVKAEVVTIPYLDFKGPPYNILFGDPIPLVWTTANVDSCTASEGWSGSKSTGEDETEAILDKPVGNHTFKLSCTGSEGSVSKTVNARVVSSANSAPDCDFSASPTTILQGKKSKLSWSCHYAESCSIDNGVGSVNRTSGNKEVKPLVPTAYTLTCENSLGENSYTTNVNVVSGSGEEVNP